MWKPIPSYEGRYSANEKGEIRSEDMPFDFIAGNKRIKYTKKGKILKQTENSHGYLCVSIHKDGKQRVVQSHILIAKTFLPNPENKPQINHKDGNKKNNAIENLEWVTARENLLHAFKTGLNPGSKPWTGKKGKNHCRSIPVIMCSLNGEEIQEFENMTFAANYLGVNSCSHISQCAKGQRKSCGGYKWKYKLSE